MEDPSIRILLELKKEIEEERERLAARLEQLRSYLHALDAVIGIKSFATADTTLTQTGETAKVTSIAATKESGPHTIEIFNKARTLPLATMYVESKTITIKPAEHALYDIKRGAFARFFVERILGKFQQEDRHRVENGEIQWAEAFDFEVKDEDGHLKEIVIRNFGTDERLQEIQRALRWALEKIYTPR